MAIIIKESKKGINWFAALVALFLFLVIIVGGYFLFFTSIPGIESVVPSSLRSVKDIANIDFDPTQTLNHNRLKSLRQYDGVPSVGNLGRENPLISF